MQYSAHHVVGDRFALLAHAVGFIDPLYSKGLYVTHMSVMVVADLILKAHQSGDYSAAAFAPLETLTHHYMHMHDQLVAGSFKSWAHPELWRVYSVLWLLGAYLEYLKLTVTRLRATDRADYLTQLRGLRLAGGGFDEFFVLQEQIDALIDQVDPDDEADVQRTVAQIHTLFGSFKWMSSAIRDLLSGKNHLPNNKLRVNLFNKSDGFFGDGAYRDHFFGDAKSLDSDAQSSARAGALLGCGACGPAAQRPPGKPNQTSSPRGKRATAEGVDFARIVQDCTAIRLPRSSRDCRI